MSPSEDVVVRRCLVRVVRHGGWSWGLHRRELVDRVVRSLPELIAQHVGRWELGGGDVVVTEPLRITVRVRLRDLLSGDWAPEDTRSAHADGGPPTPAPGARPGRASQPGHDPGPPLPDPGRRAGPGAAAPVDPAAPPTPATRAVPAPADGAGPPAPVPGGPAELARFLADAHVRGQLVELLALLPSATLATWHRLLLAWVHHLVAGPAAPAPPGMAPGSGGPAPPGRPPGPAEAPLRRLAELHRQAVLAEALALLPPATLEAWRRAAQWGTDPGGPAASAAASPGPGAEPGRRHGELLAEVERALTTARRWRGAPDRQASAQLGALAALAAARGVGGLPRVFALLAIDDGGAAAHPHRGAGPDRPVRPGEVAGRRDSGRAAPGGGAERPGAAVPGPRPVDGSLPVPAGAIDREVSSALPFLLLGPLSQVGYLQTIGPALEAADLAGEGAAFATALAYTVLGPLERGWRRHPADQLAAATFAGLLEPLPETALVELARRAPPALPALDGLVAGSLAQGHGQGRPLLLNAVGDQLGGGLVLTDQEGLFPLAWVDGIPPLLPVWRACGCPLLLVGPSAVAARTIEGLDAAGVRFVVGVPPTRHERWRRLPSPQRLWTNDHETAAAMLARLAARTLELTTRVDDLVDALARERRAVPLAADPALGRSLHLAAALGLGTIAWTLWRDREPTDPLLALERFADLGARVRFTSDRVQVRLPLGRRHADLLEHGLLADVAGVPWLGGRVIDFSGG